ncbi:MAG: FadR family transcriptional regulator [Microbacteriaceae bacterium]|nr:MAG: FadR family transcriptional regulator [Microbacteriaceae bacterium]
MFTPIEVHRTFETVIERILDAIDRNGLRDGDQLPHVQVIAEQLQVSVPTLRQALRVLQDSGVLSIKAGQGGGVSIKSVMPPLNILKKNIAQEVGQVQELIEARRLLEPIVVHLAAERATVAELDSIRNAITHMETHIANPKLVERADVLFHRRVAYAAGNRVLLDAISKIYQQLIPVRGALHMGEVSAEHMIDVHTRQFDMIQAKDHEQLESVLRESFIDLEEEFGVHTSFETLWGHPLLTPRPLNGGSQ